MLVLKIPEISWRGYLSILALQGVSPCTAYGKAIEA